MALLSSCLDRFLSSIGSDLSRDGAIDARECGALDDRRPPDFRIASMAAVVLDGILILAHGDVSFGRQR
jgi:hypothetical protein